MRRRRNVLATAILAGTGTMVVGVAGYMVISGVGFTDALYMTVITLTTVGYREVVPITPAAQYFTMALLVVGLGIIGYGASQLARELIEGELQRILGRRKVQREIAHMRHHVIVCGYGRMGRVVCQELAAKPAEFVVVDRDPVALRGAAEAGYRFIEGDATDDAVLAGAGVERAAGLVAALLTDADNVYVVLSARGLNPDLAIVARAEDEQSERKLMRAGATRVVSPYVIGGHRMAHALLRPAVVDIIDLVTRYRTMELQIEEMLVGPGGYCDGQTLAEAGIPETAGLLVVAVQRGGGDMLFNPSAATRLSAGDRLIVMGQAIQLRDLERRFRGA